MIQLLEGTVKAKEAETQCLRDGYQRHINQLKDEKHTLDAKTTKVKQYRVDSQMGIREIEKKLEAMKIDPDGPTSEVPEGVQPVNPNEKVESAQNLANDILKDLQGKLQFLKTGENEEEHFLRELS